MVKVEAIDILAEIEWGYPPADAVKTARSDSSAWRGPARCPVCMAEANPAGKHRGFCRLVVALRG